MESLPPELIFPILSQLEGRNLVSAFETNKQLAQFANDPALWRERMRQETSRGIYELYLIAEELFIHLIPPGELSHKVKNQIAFKGSEFLFSWQRNFFSAGEQASEKLFNYFMKCFDMEEGIRYTMHGLGMGYYKANLISPLALNNKYDNLLVKLYNTQFEKIQDLGLSKNEYERRLHLLTNGYAGSMGISGRKLENGPLTKLSYGTSNDHYAFRKIMGSSLFEHSRQFNNIRDVDFTYPALTPDDFEDDGSFNYNDNVLFNPYNLRSIYFNLPTNMDLIPLNAKIEIVTESGYLPGIFDLIDDKSPESVGINFTISSYSVSQFNVYHSMILRKMHYMSPEEDLFSMFKTRSSNINLLTTLFILSNITQGGTPFVSDIVKLALRQYDDYTHRQPSPTVVFKFITPQEVFPRIFEDEYLLSRSRQIIKNWIKELIKLGVNFDYEYYIPIVLTLKTSDYHKADIIAQMLSYGTINLDSGDINRYLRLNLHLDETLIKEIIQRILGQELNNKVNIGTFDGFAREMISMSNDDDGLRLNELLQKLIKEKKFTFIQRLIHELIKQDPIRFRSLSKLNIILRYVDASVIAWLIKVLNSGEVTNGAWRLILTESLYHQMHRSRQIDFTSVDALHGASDFSVKATNWFKPSQHFGFYKFRPDKI